MTAGLLIAAPRSGSGKTTVTLGLLRAFAQDGVAVQPFKCGPDYIDPGFHTAACGVASLTLDSWAMPGAMLDALAGCPPGTLALAEGSMGLFDGAGGGAAGSGASADIAARTGWPVVLVIDVSGQAQSAAAVAAGFAGFRADVRVAGVILNRVASPRHARLVGEAMAAAGIAVFGALPKRDALALPERHLGLIQAEETAGLAATLDALAVFVRGHVDLTALREAAAGSEGPAFPDSAEPDAELRHAALPINSLSDAGLPAGHAASNGVRPPGLRIALARDAAFSFVYPHLLASWRAAGAAILPFSPLADEGPDDSADVTWLPGGYPELHAGRIAAAAGFRERLVRFARTRPVHGECGGYMVLGAGLTDAAGARHAMTGLLGLETSYAARRMNLGYRAARLLVPMPGQTTGTLLRGHEFHYSTVTAQPDPALARVTDATGAAVAETGSWRGLVTGSYFHLIAAAAG